MTATTSNAIGRGRLVTAFATSDPATGPPADIGRDCDAASVGAPRARYGRGIGAALAEGERVIVEGIRWIRDGRARRQTVRELRLMGSSRLADIGIEPDRIEQVVDAMIAARRSRSAMQGQRSRSRPE